MEVQHGDLEWMFSMGTLAWGCQVLRWKSAPNERSGLLQIANGVQNA